MAFSPGRNVGRLSIRVVPDTTKFRRELKNQLETIERTTRMTVQVNKAKIDNVAIREDIRRQMAELKNLDVEANVIVTVDKAKLRKASVRQSIQAQFDQMKNVRVWIKADIGNTEQFEKQVRDMVDRAERNKAQINVNAATLAASAQMKWVARDRFVNLIVKVNKASVVSALTTLAALSGARLSWKWIDDLATSMKDLDKNLPAILGWTTGITSLVASLFAATSGLVGIGQGLFTILPAFLVLPGLLLNAVGSVTALIVALKNAGTELAPLKDDMSELGDIINEAFWGKARQPILDLVNGLMPQLRTSFHDLSSGIGEFTGAMSKAFGEELANGRLASIFNGIAEGWRVLGTGASGFAGALVSLSNIAATYTPRLAGWFVRQANTFDTWLKAISEDGRLGSWMETAIDSMYDLWDATTGVAGIFEGLWRAADAAGSGGLHGFAQMMLDWENTVKGAEFQRGLTAVFRGSGVAMRAFGDAIRGIGRLVADLDTAFEKFIGSAGIFLGGLIEGAANALNQPAVEVGMFDLSQGLIDALEGILPHLPAIAETFGKFLGLLGDIAGNILPAAATVLADLMPSINGIIDAIRPILPDLATALVEISQTLGPALANFVKTAMPPLSEIVLSLSDLLVSIAPALTEIINLLSDLVKSLADLLGLKPGQLANQKGYEESEFAPDPSKYTNPQKYFEDYVKGAQEYAKANPIAFDGYLDSLEWDDKVIASKADEIRTAFGKEGEDAAQALWDEFSKVAPTEATSELKKKLYNMGIDLKWSAQAVGNMFVEDLQSAFHKGGIDAVEELWNTMAVNLDPTQQREIIDRLGEIGVLLELELAAAGGLGGGGFSRGMTEGITSGIPQIEESMGAVKGAVGRSMSDSGTWLTPSGLNAMNGFRGGLSSGVPSVTTLLSSLGGVLAGAMAGAGSWLVAPGAAAMGGMRAGALSARPGVVSVFSALGGMIRGAASGISLFGTGSNIMGGLAAGMRSNMQAAANVAAQAVNRAVAAAKRAGEIRSPSKRTAREIGKPLMQGISVGIQKESAGVRASMANAIDFSGMDGSSPVLSGGSRAASGVNLHIHNPVVKDLQAEAWESAQMVGALI